MSCVAGLVDKNTVYMAADTVATLDSLVIPEKTPKILRIYNRYGDAYLIGCVGSTRISQIIKYYLDLDGFPPEEYRVAITEHMVTTFVPNLRESLLRANYVNVADKEASVTLLVGAAGRLFTIMNDYQVSEACDYDAIGPINAIAVALGSLHTTGFLAPFHKQITPASRVKYALEAVVAHEMNCGGHVIVEEHKYVHGSIG